ncbi:MAG: hypothetical protein ABI821_11045 [Pseudomonadota bacterium]
MGLPAGAAATLARAALPMLLRMDPERAHALALRGLQLMRRAWPASEVAAGLGVELFNLRFAHPVGLAAGFDKDGDYLDALGACIQASYMVAPRHSRTSCAR